MEAERIELSIFGCKPNVFPLALRPRNFLVHGEGLEPPYPQGEDALQAPAFAALPTMHLKLSS